MRTARRRQLGAGTTEGHDRRTGCYPLVALVLVAGLLSPIPSGAATEPGASTATEETWAVLGLRHRQGPSMGESVATLRGALALELSAREHGQVLDDEETRSRFGLGSSSVKEIRAKVDAAELYYFQLELGLARDNLERALVELSYVAGAPDAWERSRVAKMLLGMVHLAEGGVGARSRALQRFEEVARIRPELLPSELVHPPEVLALYREARERVEALPRGRLRVICGAGCATGQVWVDSQPMGVPGEAIELPAGTYGVLLTDRFEKPRAISWLRHVPVEADGETVVHVDLPLEASVRGAEGPSLLVDQGIGPEAGALRTLSERVDVDRLLIVEAVEGGFRGRVIHRSGRVHPIAVSTGPRESQEEALGRLARAALGEESITRVASATEELRVDASPGWLEESEPNEWSRPHGEWMTWGKWSAAGATLVAAGVGTALHLDANQREESHLRRWRAWGHVYPSEGAAAKGRREVRSIQRASDWGTGLLITAGVAAVTGATLFWLDAGRPPTSGTIEW